MVQSPLGGFDGTFVEQFGAVIDDELLEGFVEEISFAEGFETTL